MASTSLSQTSMTRSNTLRFINPLRYILPRTIATKLSMISVVAFTIMVILGGLLFFSQRSLSNSLQTMSLLHQETQRSSDLLRDVQATEDNLSEVIQDDRTDLIGQVLAENEALLADFSTYRSVAEEFNLTADINFTDENEPLFNNIRRDIFSSVTSYRTGNVETAVALQDTINRNIEHLIEGLDRSAVQRSFLLAEELEDSIDLQVQLSNITFALLIIGTLLLVSITYGIARSLSNNIKQLQETAAKFQSGDYEERARLNTRDEIGQLASSFNEMAASIQEREVELVKARIEAQGAAIRADENSQLKSEFLSTMSHELRTPLNAIEGFTSIMLSGMGIELSPRAEDMVRRVSSNSKRLLSLINDFLDLSRIESGRMDIVRMPISPLGLAQSWENEVGILAEAKDIDFVVSVSPQLPTMILGDEDALSKITINLLSNAFKFTHEGRVSLNLERADDNWVISVSDTGIGIPAHSREYIFDEFRQVDGSTMREYGGTGLGLSLVQKLSRIMGGHVTLHSELGEGSTFIVTLPLKVPEEILSKGAIL